MRKKAEIKLNYLLEVSLNGYSVNATISKNKGKSKCFPICC